MLLLFECLFAVLAVYGAAGLVAAIPLHARGLAAIDHSVTGSGWKFRVLITPGIIALWPLLLLRWQKQTNDQPEFDRWSGMGAPLKHRSAHGLLVLLIAVLIPVLCGVGLLARAAAHDQRAPGVAPSAAATHGKD